VFLKRDDIRYEYTGGSALVSEIYGNGGRPRNVGECKGNGWQQFDYPRAFNSQGDCVLSVINGD